MENCLSIFPDADVSIIKEIIFFDGWNSYEEYGGYLIFIGIDDSIQLCEYGYCVMASDEDNQNRFTPCEITKEQADTLIEEMTIYIMENTL